MKTINEQVSVSFVSATVSDAICMMPVIDSIVSSLKEIYERYKDKAPRWRSDAERTVKDFNRVKRQLCIMLDCGFVPSDEDLADKLMCIHLENIFAQYQWDESGKLVEEKVEPSFKGIGSDKKVTLRTEPYSKESK